MTVGKGIDRGAGSRARAAPPTSPIMKGGPARRPSRFRKCGGPRETSYLRGTLSGRERRELKKRRPQLARRDARTPPGDMRVELRSCFFEFASRSAG